MGYMRDLVVNKMEKIFIEEETEDIDVANYFSGVDLSSYDSLQTTIRLQNEKIQKLEMEDTNSDQAPENDVRNHPLVWFQSILIIVLIAVLFAMYQSTLIPADEVTGMPTGPWDKRG